MKKEKQLTAVEWLEIRYIANGSYLTRSDISFAKEMDAIQKKNKLKEDKEIKYCEQVKHELNKSE